MLKKLLVLLTIFLLVITKSKASHIVGGEIELRAIKETEATHQVNVNLYFDALFGRAAAEDQNITLYFFRKRDNFLMGTATLPQISDDYIEYSKPSCALGDLQTRLIRYSQKVYLDPNDFDDALGYYIVWERCCRNNAITNIQNPGGSGSVFYLQFPALKQNGKPFAYSSPRFEPIKSDYICINQPFSFNFAGTDPDGDQLTYSMATPLIGSASMQQPMPISRGNSNYPQIQWVSGFSATNAIPGTIPLRIDNRTGRLTVTAGRLGLFVFSVLIEEFRDGKKIGEMRRDFQLKVVDCPKNDSPLVLLREQGKSFFYKENELLFIKAQQGKCFNLLINEKDIGQRVKIEVRPLNFTDSEIKITPSIFTPTSSSDTLKTQICLGSCAESETNTKALVFEVIASDDGCPLPQTDTLRVQVIIEPDPNSIPSVTTDLPNNQKSIVVGTPLTIKVNGKDLDNDKIKLEGKGRGFTLAALGITFPSVEGTGVVTQTLTWTPTCAAVNGKDFLIDFVVSDARCARVKKDSVSIKLNVVARPSQKPSVYTTLTGNAIELTISTVATPIKFDVIAQDPDNDPITLTGAGRGFLLPAVGMRFDNKSGVGKITSPFSWTPTCQNLDGKDQNKFIVDFITEDNSCQPDRFDTVSVSITLYNLQVNYDISPPNVITPNNDGKNDFFEVSNLPPDNCEQVFEGVEIYNRWGDQVFESKERDFKWLADQFSTGEYYYLIKYTRRKYKGALTVMR